MVFLLAKASELYFNMKNVLFVAAAENIIPIYNTYDNILIVARFSSLQFTVEERGTARKEINSHAQIACVLEAFN